MTKEETALALVAAEMAATIVDASKQTVEQAGGALVVIVEFPYKTGHALGLGGNKIDDAPRMLTTALAEIPGGPEYVKRLKEAQQKVTKH